MQIHFLSWRALLSRGIDLQSEDFIRAARLPSGDSEIARRSGGKLISKQLHDKERFFWRSSRPNSIPCVVKIAEKYRGAFPMAIASGGTRRLVEQQLMQMGFWIGLTRSSLKIQSNISLILTCLEAATRLGVSSEYCCVFEDGEPGYLRQNVPPCCALM